MGHVPWINPRDMGCGSSSNDKQWPPDGVPNMGMATDMLTSQKQISLFRSEVHEDSESLEVPKQDLVENMERLDELDDDKDSILNKEKKIPLMNPDSSILEAYIKVERDIQREERGVPGPTLALLKDRLDKINKEIIEADDRLKILKKTEPDRPLAGDNSVKEALEELGVEADGNLAEEHEEYVATLNRVQLAKKEVENLKQKREETEEEIKILTEKVNYLQTLYEKQDGLLARLFDGDYGSKEENRLELEMDQILSWRDAVAGADLHWREAESLVSQACEQMERALDCWEEIPGMTESKDVKYQLAEEARNLLQESAHNMQGAQQCLSNIKFPYCTAKEIATLLKAIEYIFTDMQTEERHAHAGECYSLFQQRSAALLEWIKQVINTSIRHDLEEMEARVREAALGLKRERLSLIKQKVTMEILEELEDENDALLLELEERSSKEAGPSEVTNDQLPPLPSAVEMYGSHAESLAQEHHQIIERIAHTGIQNRDRIHRNFQMKLEARRARRASKRIEELQKAALKGAEQA